MTGALWLAEERRLLRNEEAAPSPTVSAPAVIPTNPAKIPLSAIETSGFFNKRYEPMIADTAPPQAAKLVVTTPNKEWNLAFVPDANPALAPGAPGSRSAMEIIYPTAAPVWESTFDECLERRAGAPMGKGEYIPYCGASLGERIS